MSMGEKEKKTEVISSNEKQNLVYGDRICPEKVQKELGVTEDRTET